jgi:raffinose/stachyose/melibiose transport system substrate-binding protein
MRLGKIRRARLAVGAGLVAASLLSSACSGSSSSSDSPAKADLTAPAVKKGHLVFLEKWPDPKYAPYFKQVVAAYQKANPGVSIDLQAVGDQPYKDKIQVLTSAHELPDIYFAWAGDYTAKFVRAGLAADLSSVLGPDTTWGKTFTPAALKAYSYGGKQYGVPIDLDAKVFAYSKAAFAKAGIAPPTSFPELISDCGKLRAAGYTPIAFGNQYGWPAIHYLTQLNAQEVPKSVRDADYDPAKGGFTHPGYVKALEDLQQLNQHCLTQKANGISHESAQATMEQGKAAAQYLEAVEFPLLTAKGVPASFANNWGFFRMPSIPGAKGDQTELEGAPDGFIVNAKSKNQALAVDFLKFFTNQQNAQAMTKQLGWLSPVVGSTTPQNSSAQDRAVLGEMNKSSSFAIWLDTVTNARVAQAYLNGAQALLDGNKTPKQVMADVRAAAKKAKQDVGG